MKKFVGFIVNLISLISVQRAVNISYKFLTTPLKGQIKPNQIPPFLKTSLDKRLPYKDSYIQTYEWNSKRSELPIILFFHGWESNSNRWEAMINYFGDDYHYICVDAIGLGQTPGKKISIIDYSEMVSFCLKEFTPTYVISHSLGAFALLNKLASDRYPSIQKVVFLGCLDEYGTVIKNYVVMMGYRDIIHQKLVARVEKVINMPIEQYASYLLIDKCSMPILLIHDKRDDVIYEEDCVKFHQKITDLGQKLVKTDGLGHSLQDKEVYQLVFGFLQEN